MARLVGRRAVGARALLCAGCALALMALSVSLACAEDNDDDDDNARFGAIAYSPSTRSHGWSRGYHSRWRAKQKALDQCSRFASDCVVPVWFRDACGALAVGPHGYGSGWGTSRNLAERYALQSCSRYSSACFVIRNVCARPR